jgi:hypothetical protein
MSRFTKREFDSNDVNFNENGFSIHQNTWKTTFNDDKTKCNSLHSLPEYDHNGIVKRSSLLENKL